MSVSTGSKIEASDYEATQYSTLSFANPPDGYKIKDGVSQYDIIYAGDLEKAPHVSRFIAVGGTQTSIGDNISYYSIDASYQSWVKMNKSPYEIDADAFKSVCYANEIETYVTVGDYDSTFCDTNAAYSTNGTLWKEISGLFKGHMNRVCYGNGRFIATGMKKKNYYSLDGITWTATTSLTASQYGLCYDNGKFVSTGDSGYNYYTIDGITWTATNNTNYTYTDICYGNGKYVAINSGTRCAYTTDCTAWTETTVFDRNMRGICYGNGRFVAVGGIYHNYYSFDGITWTAGSTSGMLTSYPQTVCYGNGKFVLAGADDDSYVGRIFYSTDCTAWTNSYCASAGFYAICYG